VISAKKELIRLSLRRRPKSKPIGWMPNFEDKIEGETIFRRVRRGARAQKMAELLAKFNFEVEKDDLSNLESFQDSLDYFKADEYEFAVVMGRVVQKCAPFAPDPKFAI